MQIYPSLISGDILNIEKMMQALDLHCDGYHVDVMDDHFVPNLTWGPAFVSAIKQKTKKPIHMHLMVDNPEKWVDRVSLNEDDLFIFHHEVVGEVKKFIGMSCGLGVAINPETPVDQVFPYISHLDHVLIMSVRPGFSGQKFMPEVVEKVKLLVKIRAEKNLLFSIGMDGGIGLSNIAMLAKEGVDIVGAASAIFSSPDPIDVIKKLRVA